MKSQVENKNRVGPGWSILVPLLAGIVAVGLCAGLYWREASQTEKTLREREISRMGLFEHPYADRTKTEAVLNDPAHREQSRMAAERSAVLLRNEGSLLPLNPARLKSIAIIGPLAASTTRSTTSSTTSPANADAPGTTMTPHPHPAGAFPTIRPRPPERFDEAAEKRAP